MLKFLFAAWLPLYGGGKGGGPPPAPDYRGAAVEQAAAGREAQTASTFANRPTINTPFGQQTWETGSAVDPATGQPVTNWTTNINLTPEQQQALDAQMRIGAGKSQLAEGLMGQVGEATKTPFNWGGIPQVGSLGEAQQGAFGKMSAMLQPGRTQQQEALETQLANQGLSRGTEAWNREKARLEEGWATQDKGLLAQSLAEGRADVGTQQGLRQAAIAEEAQRRGMSLNELNALLSGSQVSMPGMPSFAQAGVAAPPNLLGAAGAQGNYGLQANQQQPGGMDWGSAVGGIASIAGMIAL